VVFKKIKKKNQIKLPEDQPHFLSWPQQTEQKFSIQYIATPQCGNCGPNQCLVLPQHLDASSTISAKRQCSVIHEIAYHDKINLQLQDVVNWTTKRRCSA